MNEELKYIKYDRIVKDIYMGILSFANKESIIFINNNIYNSLTEKEEKLVKRILVFATDQGFTALKVNWLVKLKMFFKRISEPKILNPKEILEKIKAYHEITTEELENIYEEYYNTNLD